MKTQPILVIAKRWLTVGIAVALLPWVVIAGAAATLDEQLWKAASIGDLKQVKTLLDKRADVNAKDSEGMTAVMMASGGDHLEVLNLLVERGGDIHVKGIKGRTALFVANATGSAQTVKLLLDKGADVNVRLENGVASLIAAAGGGHGGVVRLLLETGADLNIQARNGVNGSDCRFSRRPCANN